MVEHDPPQLYHLGRDPGEETDVAKDHPQVLAKIADVVAAHRKELKPGESQLEKGLPAAEKP